MLTLDVEGILDILLLPPTAVDASEAAPQSMDLRELSDGDLPLLIPALGADFAVFFSLDSPR